MIAAETVECERRIVPAKMAKLSMSRVSFTSTNYTKGVDTENAQSCTREKQNNRPKNVGVMTHQRQLTLIVLVCRISLQPGGPHHDFQADIPIRAPVSAAQDARWPSPQAVCEYGYSIRSRPNGRHGRVARLCTVLMYTIYLAVSRTNRVKSPCH
jgi:hypothetical protein